jgi:hypothetical protein
MPATTPLREMLATVEITISLIIKAPHILLSIRQKKTAHKRSIRVRRLLPFLTQPSALLLTATRTTAESPKYGPLFHATQFLPDTSYVSIQWRALCYQFPQITKCIIKNITYVGYVILTQSKLLRWEYSLRLHDDVTRQKQENVK